MAASRMQGSLSCLHDDWLGALAQLGERNTGSVEVSGSIPLGSTSHPDQSRKGRSPLGTFFATLADEVSSAGVSRIFPVALPPGGETGDV